MFQKCPMKHMCLDFFKSALGPHKMKQLGSKSPELRTLADDGVKYSATRIDEEKGARPEFGLCESFQEALTDKAQAATKRARGALGRGFVATGGEGLPKVVATIRGGGLFQTCNRLKDTSVWCPTPGVA